jgi:DNA-binding NarL/FixJ family response regulator
LGVGTVKVHLAALYRALDVHTRMEAVVKAGALIGQK